MVILLFGRRIIFGWNRPFVYINITTRCHTSMILYHIEINLPTTFFIPTIFGKNVAFIKTLVRLMVEFCRFWLHNCKLTIHLSVWKSVKSKPTIQNFTEKISFRSHKKLKNQSKLQKRLCCLGYCPMQIAFRRNVKTKKI